MWNLLANECRYKYKFLTARMVIIAALWPFLICILDILSPDTITFPDRKVDVLEFVSVFISISNTLIFPVVLLVVFATKLFFDEYKYGQYIIYNNRSKHSVFMAKLCTLLLLHLSYTIMVLISASLIYFLYFSVKYDLYQALDSSFITINLRALINIYCCELTLLMFGLVFGLLKGKTAAITSILIYLILEKISGSNNLLEFLFIKNFINKGFLVFLLLFIGSFSLLLMFQWYIYKRYEY